MLSLSDYSSCSSAEQQTVPEVAHGETSVKAVYSGLSFSVFTEKCSKSTPADNKKQEKDRKEESVVNLDEGVQRI